MTKNKDTSFGICIETDSDEVLIKGNKDYLLELADYIKGVACSDLQNDHIHIDDLTLINSSSSIKNLIIEKENKKNIQN